MAIPKDKDPVNLRLAELHSFVEEVVKENGSNLSKQDAIRRMLRWVRGQKAKGRFNPAILTSELEG